MRRRYAVSDSAMIRFIKDVVTARQPEEISLIAAVHNRRLSDTEREALRELLADELVETGLGPDDEPDGARAAYRIGYRLACSPITGSRIDLPVGGAQFAERSKRHANEQG